MIEDEWLSGVNPHEILVASLGKVSERSVIDSGCGGSRSIERTGKGTCLRCFSALTTHHYRFISRNGKRWTSMEPSPKPVAR
jgi:hypothetical protein